MRLKWVSVTDNFAPNWSGWSGESECESSRSRSFNCRLLVRPPDDQEETMEEKQQRVSQYENMQVRVLML